MEKLREIFGRTWVRRSVIGVYTAALSAVVAIYIGLSLLDVQTAAYFRGDATLQKGEPNPVRGVVQEAATGATRHNVEAAFFVLPPRESSTPESDEKLRRRIRESGIEVGRGEPVVHGVVQTSLVVPESVESGPYDLALRVRGPEIETFVATTRVRVSRRGDVRASWPERTSRIANEERREKLESGPVEEQSGEVAIDVMPFDGEVPRGLPGRVFLRTYDAETGEPLAATVDFEKVEGMGRWGRGSELPSSVQTDALGLAELELNPVGGQKWHLRATETGAQSADGAEPRTGSATLVVHTVASQVSIVLGRPIVEEDRMVQGEVANLFRTGELYVDAYHENRWFVADWAPIRDRIARFELALPEAVDDRWLYRLQVARGFYDAASSWDARHVVDRKALGGASDRELVGHIAKFLSEHREDDPYFERVVADHLYESAAAEPGRTTVWVRAYLSAIPRSFSRAGTIFNTRPQDREELQRWADDLQADLMIVIVIGLVGGFAVLIYVVFAGLRRNREHQERLRDVDAELAAAPRPEGAEDAPAEDEEIFFEPGTSEKIQAGLLGFVGLATFVMFALGLMLLLSYL